MLKISGLFAPLATPFTDDGHQVSEVRLARQIRSLLTEGIAGVVVATDTGEFGACGIQERKSLLELVLRECGGRAEAMVNVSSLSTSVSLDLAQHAGRHGARAAVLMPPYYGRYDEEEVSGLFSAVSRYAGIPVVVVDPFGSITPDVRAAGAENPSLLWAVPLEEKGLGRVALLEGRTGTDEFAVEGVVVSPLATIAPAKMLQIVGGSNESLDLLTKFGRMFSRARLVKAALESRNLSQGPTRGPVMALTGAPMQALRNYFEA
ncbi:MAG: dihydrodipicolinate synthase family protein [Fimbriimonadaceae bacterium]|nr:dihydrodipicolinate synthase family protein [Chthonomonadaceae bacterium]MCO5297154.1 dihydrodipicolinate synthase family protein [Fimbriimonadaceae bacterium]